jgi:hypothetical protein
MTRFSRVSKNPVVPAKVKAAWQLMQDDPKQTLQTAAAAVGLNAHKLREFLNRPHVRRWVLDERRAQLDAINAGNPEALRRLRDTTENAMAAVGAIKTLEAMKELVDPTPGRAGTTQHAPGLIVQIVHSNGSTETIGPPLPAPMIDVTPEREALDPTGGAG